MSDFMVKELIRFCENYDSEEYCDEKENDPLIHEELKRIIYPNNCNYPHYNKPSFPFCNEKMYLSKLKMYIKKTEWQLKTNDMKYVLGRKRDYYSKSKLENNFFNRLISDESLIKKVYDVDDVSLRRNYFTYSLGNLVISINGKVYDISKNTTSEIERAFNSLIKNYEKIFVYL